MKTFLTLPSIAAALAVGLVLTTTFAATPDVASSRLEIEEGPAAAFAFARSYRGEAYKPGEQYCYPDARGVPFADCSHIIPMANNLWTPREIVADFHRRMAALPVVEQKKGIIIMLKTERCATKVFRGCTVTTAALEKRATPLASEFLIYGVLLKPRDGDKPPGSLKIETGVDTWKNDAAGEYKFEQGPGATLAFLNPSDGSLICASNAAKLGLDEHDFTRNEGRVPKLHALLHDVLMKLASSHSAN